MIDKFDYYDILGIVIPGALLAYWVAVCFPQTAEIVAGAQLPEAVDVLAFVALAFFVGHLVQAAASVLERPLYWSWGGQPSERALREGLGNR